MWYKQCTGAVGCPIPVMYSVNRWVIMFQRSGVYVITVVLWLLSAVSLLVGWQWLDFVVVLCIVWLRRLSLSVAPSFVIGVVMLLTKDSGLRKPIVVLCPNQWHGVCDV